MRRPMRAGDHSIDDDARDPSRARIPIEVDFDARARRVFIYEQARSTCASPTSRDRVTSFG
jgi:hypothetical protein